MMRVFFRRLARAEFDDAADWYEAQQFGLGTRFTIAVRETLDKISKQPDFYPIVHEDVREALVCGFPYCVYYKSEPDRVVILSVFHTSRNPDEWRRRA